MNGHRSRILLATGALAAATGTGALAAGALAAPAASCSAGQLSAGFTLVPGSAGAGHISYDLKLKNRSTHACKVPAHPGLRLLDAAGHALPTHIFAFGGGGQVTIGAGHTVKSSTRFSPDIPGPGEPGTGNCEPPAHRVRVSLPGHGSLTGPVSPPTPVCEHGGIDLPKLA